MGNENGVVGTYTTMIRQERGKVVKCLLVLHLAANNLGHGVAIPLDIQLFGILFVMTIYHVSMGYSWTSTSNFRLMVHLAAFEDHF